MSGPGLPSGQPVLDASVLIDFLDVALDDIPDAAGKWRSLAFDDRTCFAAARRRGRVCVTNDRRLRAMCEEHGVRLLWGLDLVVAAFHEGLIVESRAIEIFNGIKSNAKGYITAEVERIFYGELDCS